MKRRILSIFCALCLCLGLLPGTALAADSVSYVEYSWDEDTSTLTSETKSVTEYTTVTNSDTAWSNGWYVVSGSVSSTRDTTITVSGTVNLILTQGSSLTLNYGRISISSGSTLNIYGQDTGSGTLTLGGYGRSTSSGIGLNGSSALNIHGGTITANGYCYNNKVDAAPGIDVGTGTLTVYGGEVNAEAGTYSNAGYGAGIRVTSGGTVSIYGGTVTATGASNRSALGVSGAGIGGNGGSSAGETCGTVNIYGGTVTATGGSGGSGASAGIGGGQGGTAGSQGGGGTVSIYGGTVTATGGRSTSNVQAPGIGGAVYSSNRGSSGTFSTGTNGSAVITANGGIQAGTSGCSAIIDNKVYGNVTLPDSQLSSKNLTVTNGATLTISGEKTLSSSITVNDGGTLTVSGTVTNSGTITVESGGTLTGTGTINNTDSGKVTGDTGNVKVTYPSTVEVSSSTSGTAVLGQEVTFTATVTGNDTAGTPTGTVQFKDNGNDLGTAQTLNNEGKATYTTSNLEIGEHKITAVYSGDGSYTAKTSSELTFTVVGDVASISIETQPKKMTYTTGETLDLSDLVITVHYVGSTYTQDIIWSADSGITASIENGTTLYASQHDGQTITITYGDKTATTGNLTVARANPQVTAPTAKTLTYDGTDQALVTAGGTTGGTMQYSLSEDGEYTEAIPTSIDAGQYTVYYKVVGNDDYNDVAAQSVSVTIAKANAQVTAAPQAVEALAFTGQPHALVTAGSAAGGTMQYSLSEDGEYTEAIPTGTDAGDYTVWYKVVGDNNHNDTTAQSVSVTIGKAAATVTTAPQAVTGLTYTGNPQALVTAGTAEGGEMQYSTDGSNYYTDIPTGTNAGDYSVWYKVVGDENHSDTDPVEVKITIAKATPAYTVPTGLTATYGDTLADVALPDDWAWDDAVTTSVGNVGDNSFAATFTPSDTDNYNTVTKNLTVAVFAKDITGAAITLGDALTYTGQEQTQQIASVIVDDLTVTTYEISGNTGTDADTYTLTVTGTGNFTGTATKEWTIAKANYNGATDVSGTVLANWSDKVTLPAIPAGASYGTPSTTDDLTGLSIEGGVLSYTGGESIAEGQEYEITVPVNGGQNYVDYEITVTLTGTDKQVLTITGVTAQGGTYNGQAQTGYTGTPSAQGFTGEFVVTYNTADGKAPTDAGTYTVTIAIPEDDAQYVGSMDLQFTIAPKALTVSAPSPSVYVGDSAPELALTYTGLVAGESVTPSDTPTFTITKSDNTEITLADAVKTAGTYTITWSNEGITTFPNGTNYDITKNPAGTLKVSNRPVTPAPTPSGPSTGGSDGWTEIEDEVDETPSGSTVTVDMNGTTEVPAEVFEAVAGKDVTLELDMGGGVKWEINGQDIPTDLDFTDLDLGVSLNTSDIPVDVINMVTGEKSTVQLSLAHDGEFGFTLTLTAPVGTENKGLWANLYHYNTTKKQMLFETSAQVDSSGNVALKFTHASEYAIVLDESSHELPFTDTAKGAWYQGAVEYVYRNGIMTGTSATTFSPNTAMNRAMVAQILYNLEGQPTVTGESTFTDSNTHWAAKAIAWAQKTGVVSGYGNNTFRPNQAVTREELAQMLYNYAEYKQYDLTASGDLIAFPDGNNVQGWAKTAMSWANGNQLINGFEDDTLRPGGDSTRAQAASILMNFDLNVVKD